MKCAARNCHNIRSCSLPCARVARLSSQLGPTSALGRNPLSAEEVKQFRKTANMIERQPWAMHDGSNYLRGLEATPVSVLTFQLLHLWVFTKSGSMSLTWKRSVAHGKLNGATSPRNGPKTLWSPMQRLMRSLKWMLSKMLKLRESHAPSCQKAA